MIKRYFNDQLRIDGDLTIDLAEGTAQVKNNKAADWIIHLVDTGLATNTGGRIGRLADALGSNQFMVTYGDGVSDINLDKLVHYHQSQKVMATVTAVRPPSRFGGLAFNGSRVTQFTEKPQLGEG